VAISADSSRWFLLNASPDVREQLARLPITPPEGMRHVPVEGILPTDAELDHTLGIALLREGRALHVYATHAVLEVLNNDSRVLPVTSAFADVAVTELRLDEPQALHYRDGTPSGLSVTAFAVPGGPPRFARQDLHGHTVGLRIEQPAGGTMAFVPGCGALDDGMLGRLAQADLLLFDGTFWTDDEMLTLGLSDRTALQMDHLPISGSGGSLRQLERLPCQRVVYTHINNSNPMLVEDSAQRREVVAAGLAIGDDGMRFSL
jgi:pyrroloquinoline quinone biosynthesis protein B